MPRRGRSLVSQDLVVQVLSHIHPLLPPLLLICLLTYIPPPILSLHCIQNDLTVEAWYFASPVVQTFLANLKAFVGLSVIGWCSALLPMSISWHPPTAPTPHWPQYICQISALMAPPLTGALVLTQVSFYDIILFIPVSGFITFCNLLVYFFITSPAKNSSYIRGPHLSYSLFITMDYTCTVRI